MKRSGLKRTGFSKFHAKRCASFLPEFDGYVFDSMVERRRAEHLAVLQRDGKISELKVHEQLSLDIDGHHIVNYKPDFIYRENGKTIIEDVKGFVTERFAIIRRLWPVLPFGVLRIVRDGGKLGWKVEEVYGKKTKR